MAGSQALRRSNRLVDEKIPCGQIVRAHSSVIKKWHGNQEIPEEQAVQVDQRQRSADQPAGIIAYEVVTLVSEAFFNNGDPSIIMV